MGLSIVDALKGTIWRDFTSSYYWSRSWTGGLAVRLQDLNKELLWDGPNMKFTNIHDNETLKSCLDDGFVIKDGNHTFNKKFDKQINAHEFAADLIKHTYRDG